MAGIPTIIFGAAGDVAAATAIRAQELGAKVYLGLRNVDKPIAALTPEKERAAGFERVQADLSQPDTVAEAVRRVGAKRAFLYAVIGGTNDHMRASIHALKDAGIEFVVLLSSGGVLGDIRSVPPQPLIPFAHAQIEASLDDVFGPDAYIAVRPAYFASNALWWKGMFEKGEVRTVYPEAKVDWIVPGDIGAVCGSLLVNGPGAAGKKSFVYLVGPQLVSLGDAARIIGKAVGKDVKVTQLSDEEGVESMSKESGIPEIIAKEVVAMFAMRLTGGDNDEYYTDPAKVSAVGNIFRYSGRQPTSFVEWVAQNKHRFED